VRLEARALDERLRQGEATAGESRAQFQELEAQVVRARALAAQELISPLELETLEAQLAAAVSRVEMAEATLEERRAEMREALVRAPVGGRIGRRDAEVGMLVDPSTVLFLLGDLDELIVAIPLTETMLGYLREGQTVRVGSAALSEPVEATLSRISPFLEAGSFSTSGEIDLANPEGRLRSGMFVTVDVLYGESEEATLVPAAALWEEPSTGVLGLYVVEVAAAEPAAGESGEISAQAHPAEFRPVEVRAEGGGVAGVAGVEPGEWVVTVGQHLLSRDEGTQARVRPVSWQRVQHLQALQREDLLQGFLAKQQRIARERGAEPPSNEEFLRASPAGGGGG
jgi:RND family efflux transporter MFP subunit